MSNTITISQLPVLSASQATSNDIFPITDITTNTTYGITLGVLDAYIKTSTSSGQFFSGSVQNAVLATSSISSSFLVYTGGNNGTASYAVQALTSSFSNTSSLSTSASYALTAAYAVTTNRVVLTTASFSSTASFLYYNPTGVVPNGTASFAINTSTASYTVSSSYAATSSYSINAGSTLTSGSTYPVTSSWANNSISSNTASYVNSTSYAVSASYVIPILTATIGTPEMYGAVGDGVTDDWVAIKNCVLSHSVIQFDAKTYAVRGNIPVPSNTSFFGKGKGQTIIKVMDNSPYGYSTGLRIFTSTLTNNSPTWMSGSAPYAANKPIGTSVGSGSVVAPDDDNYQASFNPNNGRWTTNTQTPWLDLSYRFWEGLLGARRNVVIKDMTLDGNFNNQAKHSSFNWVGNPQDHTYNSSVANTYSPPNKFKVRGNIAAFNFNGENILIDNVEIKGFGAGFNYSTYTNTSSAVYNENFVAGIYCPQVSSLTITSSTNFTESYSATSFRNAATAPYPITAQSTFQPSRIVNCNFTSSGNPDLQDPNGNQTVAAVMGTESVTINGTGSYLDILGVLSSIENCTILDLYSRIPCTASIWSGSIMCQAVSSSYTDTSLLGSSDGIVSGTGYLTGSIGQWAITNNYYWKKVNDGTSYGRWENKGNTATYEYDAQSLQAAVVRNNFVRGIGRGAVIYQDTGGSSYIIDGNTWIEVNTPISLNINTSGILNPYLDLLVIKNNYIQLIDMDVNYCFGNPQIIPDAISIAANNLSNNPTSNSTGQIIIQNNTIRIPAGTSRYAQKYFPSINTAIGTNAPWELQNFSGSINGTIIGSGSGTAYSGSYNQTFTNFNGFAYSGSVTGSAFFNNFTNLFQQSIAYPTGTSPYFKGSNTQRHGGIYVGIDKFGPPKDLVIEGNTFINYNPSKIKGYNYNVNSAYDSDIPITDDYFYHSPVQLAFNSYTTSSYGLEDCLTYISQYTIENNYDDKGNLTPLNIENYYYDNGIYSYNIPNYTKDNLFLERSSITTPNINLSKNILSSPYEYNGAWTSSGQFSSNNFFSFYGTSTSSSISLIQNSSSFTNQLVQSQSYILEYKFYEPTDKGPQIISPGISASVNFNIASQSLFTWNNAIHNTSGIHRVFFTTTGSLANPTGSFSLVITSSNSQLLTMNFDKVAIYQYYPTASVNWNIKNTILNLDDNVYLTFTNTGSYTTGSYSDVNNNIGQDIPPNNQDIFIKVRQPATSSYVVTWPSNINWLRVPSTVAPNTAVTYNIKYDRGNYYGTFDVEPTIITASLYGTASYAMSASYALNGGGGGASSSYFSGSSVIAGTITAGTINGTTTISGAAISGGNFFISGNITNGITAGSTNVNIIGNGAGANNQNGGAFTTSNIFGVGAAAQGSSTSIVVTTSSNFFGYQAGNAGGGSNYNYASNTNLFGYQAGWGSSIIQNSNFFGYQAGYNAPNASNCIFIGYKAGYSDSVGNTTSIYSNGNSNIAIGDYSGTKGFTNSITIGRGTGNSAVAQANIGNVFWINGINTAGTTPSNTAITTAKIGIGTNSPNSSLQIVGNVSASNYTASSVGVGFLGTSSWSNNVISSSYTVTASYAPTVLPSSITASFSGSLTGSVYAPSILIMPVSASANVLTPTVSTGSHYFYTSGVTNLLYIYNGTRWTSSSLA